MLELALREPEWTIQQARDLYHIAQWSDGFFDIAENGHVVAKLQESDHSHQIDLAVLAQSIKEAGISFPVLLRFTDILKQRIQKLHAVFSKAITDYHYQGQYISAYPIKVNQQYQVVKSILDSGELKVGLETGSKPELLAALSIRPAQESMLICNGYKDKEYIRLALIGQRIGHRVLIILEKMAEVDIVIQEAERMQIEPMLGIRVRLSSIPEGKWQDSSGEKSKFGFSAPQVLTVVNKLKQQGKLHYLKVLHCHFGSQVANINHIQRAIKEAARYYAGLHSLGAPIETIDVGGGLGVDYQGTRSPSFCSTNYSMQEYANNILDSIVDICDESNLPHPNIITESGRAITAHHAVLITNIISTETPCDISHIEPPLADDHQLLHNLWECFDLLSKSTAIEIYHNICYWMTEAHTMYLHGVISLEKRAYAEQVYFSLCYKLKALLSANIRAHRNIIDDLNRKLANKHLCNFSIFQSLPDAWAINQVFPIMALSGLNVEPTNYGVLHDITCDSDGCIKQYVNHFGLESTLPLPVYNPLNPFLLGIFLVGAYQEILGDLHNLFGDTNSIHVGIDNEGGYKLTHAIHGDTVASTLKLVDFNSDDMLQSFYKQLSDANLEHHEYDLYLDELQSGLQGYTYFEE